MTSIAELGIKVDSTDAAQASSDLDKLAAAGSRAERASEGVSKGADKVSTSLKKQKDELAELLGEINPTVKALGRLDELEAKLARHKGVGLDAATFSEYQGKIQQSREALGRFDDSMNRTGNTAKQNAAALRMLPAQFSDIFVSLQGGQAPLTVFLQQGSQIKDSFGGIGAATKALGGYIGGLISPVTIAGAALAGLGLAFYSAQKEASDFNKALFSGAASTGFTSDGLSSIATAASVLTGSFSQAKEAVMALAGSGRLSEKQFVSLANAAAAIGEITGKSAGEVAASLGGMGDNATKAAQKISSQYGLLTAAQYEAIAALDEQGKKQEALDLLGETLNTNAQKRLERYKQSLSGVEAGWDAIGSAISRAYRNVRSELFPDAKKEIEILERIIKTREDGGIAGAISSGLSKLNSGLGLADGENDDSTAALQKRLAGLKAIAAASEKAAKEQGDADRAEQARIDAIGKWDARQKSNLTGRAKLESDIKDARQLGIEAGRSEVEIQKEISGIREKFNKSQPKSGVDLTSFNDSKNQLNAVLSYYKSADKELEAAQKAGIISQESYTAQRVALLQQQASEVKSSYEAEIAALEGAKGKASTSAAQRIQLDQKIADARANMVKAQQESDSDLAVIATNEQGRLKKQELAIKSYTDALDQQNAALQRAGSRAAQGVGQSDRQNAINGDLNGISDRANQQRLDLARDKADASRNMSAEEYQAKLEAINRSERDLTQTTLSNYEQMSVAQSDWRNGATSAFSNYLDSARDVAGQTRSLFTNAFSSMEDAVASFATNGKFSFSDFAKSIIADMARIATRQAASGLLSSLAGSALGAYFGGGAAAGAGAGSFGSSIGSAITANAKGGVYDSPSLSSFSNQVHDKPQMFAFAKGAGIFAEAGPEAIMPLTRTAGGELGVRALGGGGGVAGGNTYNFPVSVSVQTTGDAGSGTQEDTTQAGRKIQQVTKAEAEAAIARGVQPGGAIWRAINGRG